jgi:hypothetical protein
VRNKTALPELAASHHQQVAVTINIAQAQPTDLTSAQAQSVAETKDDAIRGTALSGPRIIRKCSRRSQQAASLDDVENERDAAGGYSSLVGLERRAGKHLLDDGPIQKAAKHTEEVVEAPRTASGSLRQERLQCECRELVQIVDAMHFGEAHQKPQLVLLADVLAPESSPVLHKTLCGSGKALTH